MWTTTPHSKPVVRKSLPSLSPPHLCGLKTQHLLFFKREPPLTLGFLGGRAPPPCASQVTRKPCVSLPIIFSRDCADPPPFISTRADWVFKCTFWSLPLILNSPYSAFLSSHRKFTSRVLYPVISSAFFPQCLLHIMCGNIFRPDTPPPTRGRRLLSFPLCQDPVFFV